MKKELRKVPLKNYIILFVVAVLTVVLCLYIREWILTYKETKISISPLSGEISEVNTNELDLILTESNQVVLYVSYVNNLEVYNKEIKLLKKIKSEELNEYIIYYNVTDLLENKEYLNVLKTQFKTLKNEIKKAPLFIYIKNGEGIEVINSNDEIVNDKELIYLIDKYEIGE